MRLLGTQVEIKSYKRFEDVFQSVGKEVEGSLVPIENSLTGSIHRNYDLLLRHKLKINAELYLRIHHCLIGVPGSSLKQVERVISHPVALNQCEKFFIEHPAMVPEVGQDTSGSVREILAANKVERAAIAGRQAAEFYGGRVLAEGIEDNPENYTRFVLLQPEMRMMEKANKTSIVFSFKNVPGALFKSLSVFALRDIDLAKIESRPIHGRPWQYLFYLDFLGNVTDDIVRNALNHLSEITELMEVLGCYARDTSIQERRM